METARHDQNFGNCQLGDQRLPRRAHNIGQALSEKFGQGLSQSLGSTSDFKRAYEFSPMAKPALRS
ncbi:MAG: transposase DNA-binding-containing protein [Thermosynechococcaceae cyanobacterium]